MAQNSETILFYIGHKIFNGTFQRNYRKITANRFHTIQVFEFETREIRDRSDFIGNNFYRCTAIDKQNAIGTATVFHLEFATFRKCSRKREIDKTATSASPTHHT